MSRNNLFSDINKQSLDTKDITSKSETNVYDLEESKDLPTNSIPVPGNLHDKNDLELFQSKSFLSFYDMYHKLVNSLDKVDPQLVKRSFDDYIDRVESQYIKGISHIFCNESEEKEKQYQSIAKIIRHHDHSEHHLKVLGYDYYVLFKVIDMVWKNESIKKHDILLLTPCRVFLLNSLVKRRFKEELEIG